MLKAANRSLATASRLGRCRGQRLSRSARVCCPRHPLLQAGIVAAAETDLDLRCLCLGRTPEFRGLGEAADGDVRVLLVLDLDRRGCERIPVAAWPTAAAFPRTEVLDRPAIEQAGHAALVPGQPVVRRRGTGDSWSWRRSVRRPSTSSSSCAGACRRLRVARTASASAHRADLADRSAATQRRPFAVQ